MCETTSDMKKTPKKHTSVARILSALLRDLQSGFVLVKIVVFSFCLFVCLFGLPSYLFVDFSDACIHLFSSVT